MSFEYSQVAVLVFLLYVTSTAMVLYNKWIVNWCPGDETDRPAQTMFTSEEEVPIRCPGLGFPYPLFIACTQFTLHTVIGFVIVHVLRLVPIDGVTRRDFWLINLQGACVGCFVGLANLSFLFIDASLFEEVRQLATVFTLLISYAVGLEKPSWTLFLVILMIAGGVGLAVAGEEASPGQFTGIVWVVMSCVVTALSNVLVQVLVQEKPGTPTKSSSSVNYDQLSNEPDAFDEEFDEDEQEKQQHRVHKPTTSPTPPSTRTKNTQIEGPTEMLSLLRPGEDSTSSESSNAQPTRDINAMDALAAAARGESGASMTGTVAVASLPVPSSISIDLSGLGELQETPLNNDARPRANSSQSPPIIGTGSVTRKLSGVDNRGHSLEEKYTDDGELEMSEYCSGEGVVREGGLVSVEETDGRGMLDGDEDAGQCETLCRDDGPDPQKLCGATIRNKIDVIPSTSPHNSKARMHPVLILYLHSPASVLVLLPFFLFVELPYMKTTPFMVDSVYTSRMLAAIASGGILAFILQWVHYKLTSVTSAITLCVVGTCKTVVVIAAGVFTFQNKLTFVNLLGFMICFLGLLLYTKIRAGKMAQKGEVVENKE